MAETGTAPHAAAAEPSAGEAFRWTAHPARERPGAAVAAVACIVLLGWAAALCGGGTGWGIAAAVALCLVLQRFFFATRYEIDERGIRSQSLIGGRALAWKDVRRTDIGPAAAWLSPSPVKNWREGRRGIHVLYGADRAAVLARLRRHLPAGEVGGDSY